MREKLVAENTSATRTIAPYVRGAAREAKARELAQRIVLGGQTPLEAAVEMSLTRSVGSFSGRRPDVGRRAA